MKKEEKKRIMDKEKGKTQRTSAAQHARGRSEVNVKNHASAGAKKQYKGWYCFGNQNANFAKEIPKENWTDACSVAYNGVEDKEWTGDAKEASCNKDNPFHHPYHHGADPEAREDTILEDAKLFGTMMFPSEHQLVPGDFSYEGTVELAGEPYAQTCQNWLDKGGLPNSKTTPATEKEKKEYADAMEVVKSRDDPSNFSKEEIAGWKEFFAKDLARMKELLKEQGLLAESADAAVKAQ